MLHLCENCNSSEFKKSSPQKLSMPSSSGAREMVEVKLLCIGCGIVKNLEIIELSNWVKERHMQIIKDTSPRLCLAEQL